MKDLFNFINESDNARYSSNWQWFNTLVTNVELTEQNYRDLFANLSDAELKVWMQEVKDCYAGTPEEEDANKIGDDIDLARFYSKYPVTQ